MGDGKGEKVLHALGHGMHCAGNPGRSVDAWRERGAGGKQGILDQRCPGKDEEADSQDLLCRL